MTHRILFIYPRIILTKYYSKFKVKMVNVPYTYELVSTCAVLYIVHKTRTTLTGIVVGSNSFLQLIHVTCDTSHFKLLLSSLITRIIVIDPLCDGIKPTACCSTAFMIYNCDCNYALVNYATLLL